MKKFNKISIIVLAIAFTFSLAGLVKAATSVSLGTADSFAVLAGSTITNTGSSTLSGYLGLSPGSVVTGFPPGIVSGTQHIADAAASQAKVDLVTAYNSAASQSATTVPTELGGTTKIAGVYDSAAGTFGITGTLTLDAQGNPDAVFIFKTASTLITAASSSVVLKNGAQACNVFWQVGSSATLGANSTFKGNILASSSATLTTGANVEGRVLAQNGAVTLDTNNITKATCVVPPAPSPAPSSTPVLVSPSINITKVPTPLSLPAGPGAVTYDYAVSNTGTVAMSNVVVTDNKCSAVNFVSGDTNGDSKLDLNEIWKYRCSTTLSQTTTNTATATGQANGFIAIDTVNATVVVNASIVPPLIHIVKKSNVSILPAGGGAVVYTYTVTNPGTAPLSNVSVIDNKCSPVSMHSGDTNSNNILESNETWTFTCNSNLTQTTTNTGTAEGSANGLTAIDFSLATVAVTPPAVVAAPVKIIPKLPKTGFPPEEKNNSLSVIIPAGILISMFAFYLARRKQII